jgi:RimJ/RimL family protein N-acetyltransferase
VRLRFEPLAQRHLADVAAAFDDADSVRFTRFPSTGVETAFLRAWLDGYALGRLDGTREGFAVRDEDGTFVGVALAPTIEPDGAQMELGYVVTPAARGRGVATALLRELTRWAFEERAAQRVHLVIDVGNAASMAVAARAGYTLEGVHRNTYVKPGVRADTAVWARVSGDDAPSPEATDVPDWPLGTVVVLSTGAGPPHAIPVSAALRADARTILVALARRRESLARLRRDPRVALTVLASGRAFTAHAIATVAEEALAEAENVAAVRLAVHAVQDHTTPAFELRAPVGWDWVDPVARERDGAVRAGLRRIATGESRRPARP